MKMIHMLKLWIVLAKGKTITYGIERNATCIGSHLRYKKTVLSLLANVMTKYLISSCL